MYVSRYAANSNIFACLPPPFIKNQQAQSTMNIKYFREQFVHVRTPSAIHEHTRALFIQQDGQNVKEFLQDFSLRIIRVVSSSFEGQVFRVIFIFGSRMAILAGFGKFQAESL